MDTNRHELLPIILSGHPEPCEGPKKCLSIRRTEGNGDNEGSLESESKTAGRFSFLNSVTFCARYCLVVFAWVLRTAQDDGRVVVINKREGAA